MPVSNALKRLLRIRDLEQEQHRMALESALTEMRAIEKALNMAGERARLGRGAVSSSAQTGENLDRHSGLMETEIGKQHAYALKPALSRAAAEALHRQQAFLAKRMEHRQAETLIREAQAEDAIEAARQSQQSLDEWFRTRMLRQDEDAE